MTVVLTSRDIIAIVMINALILMMCFIWLKDYLESNIESFSESLKQQDRILKTQSNLITIHESEIHTDSQKLESLSTQVNHIHRDICKDLRKIRKQFANFETSRLNNQKQPNKRMLNQTSEDWQDDAKETQVFSQYVPFKFGS